MQGNSKLDKKWQAYRKKQRDGKPYHGLPVCEFEYTGDNCKCACQWTVTQRMCEGDILNCWKYEQRCCEASSVMAPRTTSSSFNQNSPVNQRSFREGKHDCKSWYAPFQPASHVRPDWQRESNLERMKSRELHIFSEMQLHQVYWNGWLYARLFWHHSASSASGY